MMYALTLAAPLYHRANSCDTAIQGPSNRCCILPTPLSESNGSRCFRLDFPFLENMNMKRTLIAMGLAVAAIATPAIAYACCCC